MYYRATSFVVMLFSLLLVPGSLLAQPCPVLEGVRLVAAGDEHVLAVTEDNALYAWGANDKGQLGDGTYSGLSDSLHLLPSFGDVTMLATGEAHSLAVTSDGRLYAWGANESGQLGLGTTNEVNVPTLVMINVVAVSAERSHSFAVTSSGRLYAWGKNDRGQLGLGDTVTRNSPALVSTLHSVSSVSAGWIHTLAVTDGGEVYAWGANFSGQLGDGTTDSPDPVVLPIKVQGLPVVKAVSAGSGSSFALTEGGELYSWGSSFYGTLGFGDTENRAVPEKIPGLEGIVGISVGTSTVLARLNDGSVLAWGSNAWGKVGIGDEGGVIPHVYQPARISSLPAARQVFSARRNSYVVSAMDGMLFAWGANYTNQLLDAKVGNGSTLLPEPVASTSDIGSPIRIAVGRGHTMVLDANRQVWVAGDNFYGQLGLGELVSSTIALTPVPGLSDIVSIAAGLRHSLALRANGEVLAWGENQAGQVSSSGETRLFTPVAVGISGVTDIAAGWAHSLAITLNGEVHAWGDNFYGQLGIGNNAPVAGGQPAKVLGLQGAVSIAAGGNHSHAVLETGQVYSWGENTYSQLGDGGTVDRYEPALVASAAREVIAGDHFALYVDVFGQLFAWGNNWFGQLGLPSSYPVGFPTAVPGLGVVADAAAGYGHTMVATVAGQIMTMGYNAYGQLGLGDTTDRDGATFVGFGSGPVAAGSFHSAVLMVREGDPAAALFAVGDNREGQLGSSIGMRLTPDALGSCRPQPSFTVVASRVEPGYFYLNAWDGLRENRLSVVNTASPTQAQEWPVGGIASDVRGFADFPGGAGGADVRIAALMRNMIDGANRVTIFDPATGNGVRAQAFLTEEWNALDIASLEASSGRALAVLGHNESTGEIAVQIREAETGVFLNNAFFLNPNWRAEELLVIDGFDANSGPELGVLATNDSGQIVVMVKDAFTNTFIKNIFFLNANWTPIQAIVLDDISENGAQEIGLLAKNKDSGQLVIMIKDAATNTFLNNIFPLGSGWEPIKMVALPDENANGAQELAVLGVNNVSGKLVIQVRDAKTGEFLRNLSPLGSNWNPRDMILLQDASGGVARLSVLATRKSDDLPVVQTIEAVSGNLVSNVVVQ